ncbi:glycoside hydrolase/deacetylase [Coniochaeta ligniaria NRRL 30616]|uniref:Glycoside hydrolase/deacetylase n=1 Tax=Coniochaeta ligniaria NRRL 30616 TaxID=1408157 RepID=A0A1J7I5X9_9PEZI|nr:glycoside hydrolase/deacetylase [Coniochaeta ligniaria NRRL 30616]
MYSLLQQLFCLSLLCLSLIVNAASTTVHNASLHDHTRQHPRQWDGRARVGNVPYGSTIWTCSVPGTVALTFDDGPSAFTPGILDLLAQHDAKATFFVNGDNYGRGRIDDASSPWPALVRRMHAAGHQIGSHGWRHVDLNYASSETRFEELLRLEQGLLTVLGFYPTYFRPPFGACDAAGCLGDLAALAYHVVNFNVDTKDYEHDSPDAIGVSMDIFASAVGWNPAGSSYIVLSHDVYAQTAETLVPFMLETLADRGFRMVTVGECLGDPVENWYRS